MADSVADLSYCQKTVDWEKLKTSVKAVIIRSGYGWDNDKQVDSMFQSHVNGAKSVGMPYGIYHYSYAQKAEDAAKEGKFCVKLMKKYGASPPWPVAYDLEEPFQVGGSKDGKSYIGMPIDTLMTLIEGFCEAVKEEGYQPMVYASSSILNRIYAVYPERMKKYPVWVAHYGVAKPSYKGPYVLWQYTSTGQAEGVAGRVDMNWAYKNYGGEEDGQEEAQTLLKKVQELKDKNDRMTDYARELAELAGKIAALFGGE